MRPRSLIALGLGAFIFYHFVIKDKKKDLEIKLEEDLPVLENTRSILPLSSHIYSPTIPHTYSPFPRAQHLLYEGSAKEISSVEYAI